MPKKRVLPYILLGLINNKTRLSGYQISQEFNNEIGEFWHASHSQVYPELQRMIDDGWICPDDNNDDSKSIFYLVTSEGASVLTDWLKEPLSQKDDLFSVKLYFIKDKNSPILKKLIEQQMSINKAHYSHLLERQELLFSSSENIDNNYGHYLILTRAIEREKNHIDWLTNTLSNLK
ncbi:PadR family transcriptional regulator [Companilactobacillus hulinensis]|uniref:PadR family transcriptional regulator n=1 Tax=Companilactobacillus hulinensis TaxID=2486007 RepID=UPI000F7A7274|nr:PadR family transcriptional regulator [Companilactobacillus hulinensis]